MNEMIKLNKVINIIWKGILYTAGIIILLVSILGYVASFSDMIKFLAENEEDVPRLIYAIVFGNVVFIALVASFVFMTGRKLNLKVMLTINYVVPLSLFVFVGYLLAEESIGNIFDVSNHLFLLLFIIAVFLGGMKVVLLLFEDYNLVKKETVGPDIYSNEKDD